MKHKMLFVGAASLRQLSFLLTSPSRQWQWLTRLKQTGSKNCCLISANNESRYLFNHPQCVIGQFQTECHLLEVHDHVLAVVRTCQNDNTTRWPKSSFNWSHFLVSDNVIVNFVARHGVFHSRMFSCIGRNFQFCCNRYRLRACDLVNRAHYEHVIDMHKRGLWRHALSVRPSVTFVDSVKTSNRILGDFLHHRRHHRVDKPFYSDGNPRSPKGASNAMGYEKNRDFPPLSHFI